MNVRVHVKNELESRVVQERAFELGFCWGVGKQTVDNLEYNYLFLEYDDMSITHVNYNYHDEDFEEISFPTFITRYIDKLPEKWAIEVKKEYMDDLKLSMDKDTFTILSNLSPKHGYFHSHVVWDNGYWSNKLNEGFTEITIEQFRHLIVGNYLSFSPIPESSECHFDDLNDLTVPKWGVDWAKQGRYMFPKPSVILDEFLNVDRDDDYIFNGSTILSLSFTDLISLRDYYREEISVNKAEINDFKRRLRVTSTDNNKESLKEAETSNQALQGELKEVEEAISGFITKLKK